MNKRLTVKEQKFIKSKIEGKSNIKAYQEAGYSMAHRDSAYVEASRINAKPKIQEAIERGLKKAGLTPEVAIDELAKIVFQDKELASKRLAIKDALELHGFRNNQQPKVTLDIKQAFFKTARPNQTKPSSPDTIVDIDPEEQS